jgi:hypothetical protein
VIYNWQPFSNPYCLYTNANTNTQYIACWYAMRRQQGLYPVLELSP